MDCSMGVPAEKVTAMGQKRINGRVHRGMTELRSRLFVEDDIRPAPLKKVKYKRQCGACKHKFELKTRVRVRCPECGGHTREIPPTP